MDEDFLEEKFTLNVFTDGSCVNNGYYNAKGGYGIYFPELDIRLSMEYKKAYKHMMHDKNIIPPVCSNNKCEFLGIYHALNYFKKKIETNNKNVYNKLIIISDSSYCINTLVVWYDNWIRKKKKKEKILNKEFIEKCKELIAELNEINIEVEFQHTNSHKDEPKDINSKEYYIWNGNNIADVLANTSY